MRSCQRISWIMVVLMSQLWVTTLAVTTGTTKPTPSSLSTTEDPKFVRIVEDVIPDIENSTQKVLRVNPLDAAPINDNMQSDMESSLYKIQPIMLGHRPYISSNRMRKRGRKTSTRAPKNFREDKEYKRKPKKKQLHFLYDQNDILGHAISKQMDVRTAPGAYPVYYAVSKSNGRFGKFPFKGFRNEEDFAKYLVKSKVDTVDLTQQLQSQS